MQRNLPAVIALLAPYVNSYRRYVPDFSAPINLEWGRDNRTTGLRVPVSEPAARRVENRLPGMDCNPYLGIAASLACGLVGLIEKTDPSDPFQGDAYQMRSGVPRGLGDALGLLRTNTTIQNTLGAEFCRVYSAVKELEHNEFLQVISPWEREHLLMNV
jgi:glutamine synthetase